MFFGQCVPHDGVTVMPYSVDAGVEEIMGLDVPSGCPGVVWVCFWAPGPPPHNVCCGAVRCPSSSAWFPLLVSGEGGGAWWFENWIVDASKRNCKNVSFCLSRFRQTLQLSLVSRSIVL